MVDLYEYKKLQRQLEEKDHIIAELRRAARPIIETGGVGHIEDDDWYAFLEAFSETS